MRDHDLLLQACTHPKCTEEEANHLSHAAAMYVACQVKFIRQSDVDKAREIIRREEA